MDIIKNLKDEFSRDIKDLDLDLLYVRYLGKKGKLNQAFKEIQNFEKNLKKKSLIEANLLKQKIEEELGKLSTEQKGALEKNIDLTIPVAPTQTGNFHPITAVTREINKFFHYYGFSVYDGPEIEDDYHNFEMMGVPANHPARELQGTLYILEPDALLRTQTSSIEARELKRQNPPIRFICPGKVFRNETASKSNGALFHQLQGVYVDKNVTMGNLKWVFEKSLKFILGEDTVIRFRPKYYPEVEPGLSPDIQCTFCKGIGCEICKNRGWIEIAGGGMIHPKTLEMAGINPKEYSGLAFGWGLDRIAMARFNIRDLRVMFDGSLVYK